MGAICHGTWLPLPAGIVCDQLVEPTGRHPQWGGTWVNKEVVEDGNLISSRNPDDLPAFGKTLIE